MFGLLGPNGAGKTTAVLMLLGLTEPTSGVVRVLGLDPTRQPLAVKRQVGYLPDNVGFYPGLSGRDNLRYTARLNGIPRREADKRIDALLHDVRLEDARTGPRGTRAACVSGSGIADALVKEPSVLILDEPTIAIDPAGVEELLGLLRRLVRERQPDGPALEPHPGPGPVPVRPGRVLLGGPARSPPGRSTSWRAGRIARPSSRSASMATRSPSTPSPGRSGVRDVSRTSATNACGW